MEFFDTSSSLFVVQFCTEQLEPFLGHSQIFSKNPPQQFQSKTLPHHRLKSRQTDLPLVTRWTRLMVEKATMSAMMVRMRRMVRMTFHAISPITTSLVSLSETSSEPLTTYTAKRVIRTTHHLHSQRVIRTTHN